jgi:hypothetical protein
MYVAAFLCRGCRHYAYIDGCCGSFLRGAVSHVLLLFAAHYLVPRVRFVVRTRVMCQAGRARAADAHGDIVAWLCERAPLWVVVHVCALLRAY